MRILLDVYDRYFNFIMPSCYLRHLFIVVEGIKGSRADLVAKRIAAAINGTFYEEIPLALRPLLKFFENEVTLELKQAYYQFCLYVLAEDIKILTMSTNVVVSKYHKIYNG